MYMWIWGIGIVSTLSQGTCRNSITFWRLLCGWHLFWWCCFLLIFKRSGKSKFTLLLFDVKERRSELGLVEQINVCWTNKFLYNFRILNTIVSTPMSLTAVIARIRLLFRENQQKYTKSEKWKCVSQMIP